MTYLNKQIIFVFCIAAVSCEIIEYQLVQRDIIKVKTDKDVLLPSSRIVGGVEAEPHSIKYQVGLVLFISSFPAGRAAFCGGVLISCRYVLTAAHCTADATAAEVRLGAHKILEYEPSQLRLFTTEFIVHPGWDNKTLRNDISLVRLPECVVPNEYIGFVNLPSREDEKTNFVGKLATVSGWGKDSNEATSVSPVLRVVGNYVIQNQQCRRLYGDYMHRSNVCVSAKSGKGSCNGDSGGPLTVINGDGSVILIGLTSFGSFDCEGGFPGAYTRVTSYLEWIQCNAKIRIH